MDNVKVIKKYMKKIYFSRSIDFKSVISIVKLGQNKRRESGQYNSLLKKHVKLNFTNCYIFVYRVS